MVVKLWPHLPAFFVYLSTDLELRQERRLLSWSSLKYHLPHPKRSTFKLNSKAPEEWMTGACENQDNKSACFGVVSVPICIISVDSAQLSLIIFMGKFSQNSYHQQDTTQNSIFPLNHLFSLISSWGNCVIVEWWQELISNSGTDESLMSDSCQGF